MIGQPSLLEWEAPPGSRNSDPETSHMAAASAAIRASHGRLRALRQLSYGARTDFELAAATGVIQSSIGKRRGELRDAGFVEAVTGPDGKTVKRPSDTGAPATVWAITNKGRAFLAAQEGH